MIYLNSLSTKIEKIFPGHFAFSRKISIFLKNTQTDVKIIIIDNQPHD